MAKKLTQDEFQEFMVEKIGGLQNEVEKIAASQKDLIGRFGVLQSDVNALRTEVREGFAEIHRTVDRIERTLTPLSTAVDKDAETIVEHDRRLTRIEKHMELRQA